MFSKRGKLISLNKEEKSINFLVQGKEFECRSSVYYPSEDSYLLLKSVKIKAGETVIDAGCGSGIQSMNALMKGAGKVTALDVNEEALECTLKNAEKLNSESKITAIKSDLFENCSEKADVIIFNPPYVPSDEIKYEALDGGQKGREVLDRFIEQFPKHLKENGRCYFLQTDINGFAETEEKLGKAGFELRTAGKEKGFFEELIVYEARKKRV